MISQQLFSGTFEAKKQQQQQQQQKQLLSLISTLGCIASGNS